MPVDTDPIAHSIQHIAIIMDGNGRWAQARKLPRSAGHHAGVKAARAVIEACKPNQIKNLTLFAFSSENWQRPEEEVSTLMELFLNTLAKELATLDKNNVRLRFIGDMSAFSDKLQQRMQDSADKTKDNDGLNLSIAVNYGGRWDVTQAARSLAKKVQNGILEPRHITEKAIAQHLSLADLPDPDLLIRTGNESRVSNFLMWQLAYAELHFSETLWPDFGEQQLRSAIKWFNQRQRRFGKTGEQVEEKHA
jgi:undecaprenyl diphosphate synthase